MSIFNYNINRSLGMLMPIADMPITNLLNSIATIPLNALLGTIPSNLSYGNSPSFDLDPLTSVSPEILAEMTYGHRYISPELPKYKVPSKIGNSLSKVPLSSWMLMAGATALMGLDALNATFDDSAKNTLNQFNLQNSLLVNSIPSGLGMSADDIDALLNSVIRPAQKTSTDFGDTGVKGEIGGALSGAVSGASAGASFGYLGAAIGGAVGGAAGYLTSRIKNRKAEKANRLYAIERLNIINLQDAKTDLMINNALMSRMLNLQSNMAAFGGELNTQGSNFTNGLLYIDSGGSHEINPYEGVPMGVDPEGVPNLVEEGETIFNDYVFSKRLNVPKAVRNKYKLREGGFLSFADASKKLAKESEERPNDPISQRGLEAMMSMLAQSQEEVRGIEKGGNMAAYGGNLFAGGGDKNAIQRAWDEVVDFSDNIATYVPLWLKKQKRGIKRMREERYYNPTILDDILGTSHRTNPLIPSPPQVYKEDFRTFEDERNNKSRESRKKKAFGGNLFLTGSQMEMYKDYLNADGTLNFDLLHANNSPWMARRKQILDLLQGDPNKSLNFRTEYAKQYNTEKGLTKGKKGFLTPGAVTYDFLDKGTNDRALGTNYDLIANKAFDQYLGPARTIKERHLLTGSGDPTELPEDQRYYSGRSSKTGKLWSDATGLRQLDNGSYTSEVDPKTNVETRTYFYEKATPKKVTNRYYRSNNSGGYDLVEGDNALQQIMNSGLVQKRSGANNNGGTDYFYGEQDKVENIPDRATWLRYAPAVGLGLASLSDAFNLTNRPDYTESDIVMEAARAAGQYTPVTFNPIGNYMTYRPFDRDYAINKLNAEAGASRRALLNTSGGNRATAMAGILAADNNYLNQLGELTKKAEEYNLALRQQVEDFNRATNQANSTGFLQAATANQKAAQEARNAYFKGALASSELRQKARMTSEAAKSANISGLFNALGDIGKENMAWNWRNFGLRTGTFGNISDEELKRTRANGGKLKRKKKGLTC